MPLSEQKEKQPRRPHAPTGTSYSMMQTIDMKEEEQTKCLLLYDESQLELDLEMELKDLYLGDDKPDLSIKHHRFTKCCIDDTKSSPEAAGAGILLSVRLLGILTLTFLIMCNLTLMNQCSHARTTAIRSQPAPSHGDNGQQQQQPLLTAWKAVSSQRVAIRYRPSRNSKPIDYLDVGQTVQVYGYYSNDSVDESTNSTTLTPTTGDGEFMKLVAPTPGFVARYGKTSRADLFERDESVESSEPSSSAVAPFTCPLIYEGWWPSNEKPARHLFAPTPLVVAQQFWNAMQVFQLFLLFALFYATKTRKTKKFVTSMTIITAGILPFSIYLISPAGYIFSFLTLVSCLYAIHGNDTLILSIGDHAITNGQRAVLKEETIAFLCNLCCSLYNYNYSRQTWPHWKTHFEAIDAFFQWPGAAVKGSARNCFVDENFNMLGIFKSTQIPLFVARSTGSRTGSQLFFLIWTVLPFLYCCYFGCMFLLSSQSPYKNVQRVLCSFGAFHFLFFTDVVAYRYGRGLWTPSAELFHWSERWAWRVAILLPIYQNCTNGHWRKGHAKLPVLGKLLNYSMMLWGALFLFQQVLATDCLIFVQFLNGWETKGLLEILGLPKSKLFSYHGALVVMSIMYGSMLVGGFSHYKVFLGTPDEETLKKYRRLNCQGQVPMRACENVTELQFLSAS